MIKFSSQAGESISMFDKEAKEILLAMGRSGNVPGAVKAEDIAEAIQSLEAAMSIAPEPGADQSDDANATKSVGLKTRAFPLIELLKRAADNDKSVMWESE